MRLRPHYAAAVLGLSTVAATSIVRVNELQPLRLRTASAEVDTTFVAPTTTAPPPATTTTSAPAASPLRSQVASRSAPRAPFEIGGEALALITYPWQERLSVSITFAGPRGGLRATSYTDGDHATVVVYVRPTDTPRVVAVNIAHELGHLIDYLRLTDDDRTQWLDARGRPGASWWACEYCEDYATGSGDFAETFAAWQVGAVDYRSRLAPLPGPAEMSALARFFR